MLGHKDVSPVKINTKTKSFEVARMWSFNHNDSWLDIYDFKKRFMFVWDFNHIFRFQLGKNDYFKFSENIMKEFVKNL